MSGPFASSWLSIGIVVAAAGSASAARAEEFSWQLSGVSTRLEAGDYRRDSWAVDGTYYVNPIDDSAGPKALASFLHPTTRVSAVASQSESFLERADDPTAFTLSGAYVLPAEKWYFGASYAKTDLDGVVPPVTRSDEKGYGVIAGRYLGASTTLELNLGRSEQSFESSLCLPLVPCPSTAAIPYAVETTTDSVGLDVFHVRRFRSLTYSLQGSVAQADAELAIRSPLPAFVPATEGDGPTLRVYSVAGELFPTNRLGIRVSYSRPDGDGAANAESYGVGATWFFKPRIAVQFTLSRTSLDAGVSSDEDSVFNPITHSDTAGIRFIGRL
jgi:hypothetical protein